MGLIAGTAGGYWIRRLKLFGKETADEGAAPKTYQEKLLSHVLLLTFTMGLGSLISLGLNAAGLLPPGFLGR